MRDQVLIQWSGKGKEEATWEEKDVIQNQFPEFNLEDKVASSEGGIARGKNKRQWIVYTRKRKCPNS